MKVTYNKETDALYIYMSNIYSGNVAFTYLCDPLEIKGMINLDFNADFQLVGIEIMDASKKIINEIINELI